METTSDYQCAFCGEFNTTFIDISAGFRQSYVEDCQVCCRPNLLSVTVNRESLDIQIATEYNG
ncbi:CPXCG motif-containing cysteine-rich protein [Acaryochloris sp. 'Moss Beach']|uniref:CPXCG motif-containing cysteine-rich protein n=1 Tax=Acaryochloris TaxID=155977 RepID=UPI001BAF491F|nr:MULTISPECIES: CPXCG motif-containing cysteine-rich protein [Acaryochloris]QUY44911.1 CPXCG motif-containing cysteine-rich protein [Acaryochloris marina S15]UJB69581.1 CPXCG motif-containing cysteine-rich protein [Acaryochloris sp. 'Moss Beach']